MSVGGCLRWLVVLTIGLLQTQTHARAQSGGAVSLMRRKNVIRCYSAYT